MLSLIIYGLHNLSMYLNVTSKLTFLAKPLIFFFIFLVLIFSTFGFCVNIKCYKYNLLLLLLLLLISVFLRMHTDTVMAKNIGILAILSENCNESMSQQYVQI